jgi:hypothetical protein
MTAVTYAVDRTPPAGSGASHEQAAVTEIVEV